MDTVSNLEDQTTSSFTSEDKILTCGIIMPIAALGVDYTESHWKDVREILNEAITLAGFIPRIVSDSEDSTIIHKSIINNIYSDPIIVCDVSGKNPNVMFELGMRLAFDKPVVIVKDDKTGYSFDTSNIQHLGYRKDLRHNTVESFIKDLAAKIKATYEAPAKIDYQSFLSHFGKFEIAKIENTSILGADALQKILEKVDTLQDQVSSLSIRTSEFELLYNYAFINADIQDIKKVVDKIEIVHGQDVLIKVSKLDKGYGVAIKCDSNLSDYRKTQLRKTIKDALDSIDDLPF